MTEWLKEWRRQKNCKDIKLTVRQWDRIALIQGIWGTRYSILLFTHAATVWFIFKDFNIEKEPKHEPPALKIRIFKGYSGELINEKEAKRIRKRKKKIEKQKVKMAKLSLDTGR